jgi:hypothetical protein
MQVDSNGIIGDHELLEATVTCFKVFFSRGRVGDTIAAKLHERVLGGMYSSANHHREVVYRLIPS